MRSSIVTSATPAAGSSAKPLGGRLLRAVAPGLVAAALAVAGASGCDDAAPRGPVTTEGTAPPSDVLFYPHVIYGGDAAYLVEGRWYRPSAAGWVVFTEEPLELKLLRRALEPRRASIFGM